MIGILIKFHMSANTICAIDKIMVSFHELTLEFSILFQAHWKAKDEFRNRKYLQSIFFSKLSIVICHPRLHVVNSLSQPR